MKLAVLVWLLAIAALCATLGWLAAHDPWVYIQRVA